MAITINGDGTLTGVSVGGLPDGIVDTDMLATSAVTAAKIGSLPAGSILQVVSAVFTGQESTTSTSYVDHDLNASITPSSTSSKILIVINMSVQCNGIVHFFNIARDGTDINTDADGLGLARVYSVDNNWQMASFQYLDSPAKNTSTTYRVRHKVDSGTGYIGWNSNDEQYMYLLEVAG